ncbi:PcfJ domain-containing protein [Blastopirellula sp. JC732]|uniref:PcfJ domain-containing protein n=1 Tax=Blastopirellula sediminis TaxID=2894196 RepID=A0A9X1SFF2_9BACT|nr:PcfJ domain-containing protein [Blastopirellula sediminis]MCC9609537.1 PcfJ domain-containing protein [Blastopirellula sediminis]MCC9627687.1 PcfJ domain-containing protein [Blastopirellula sediminis]
MATKQTDEEILQSDPNLRIHLRILQLGSLKEYRRWCAENGFTRRIGKSRKLRLRERRHFRKKFAIDVMFAKRRESRRGDRPLLEICRSDALNYYCRPALSAFYHASRQAYRDDASSESNFRVLRSLISYLLRRKVRFLDGSPYYPQYGQRAGNSALEALPLIVAYRHRWIRPVESWEPTSHSPRRQFKSLMQHLFVRYGKLPAFLDKVWFGGFADRAELFRPIYLHAAAGLNLASCELMPFPYTKKMAHHFLAAPQNPSIEQALRWGEVKGMGGDDKLAHAVMNSRLTVDFRHHKFWNIVLQWLIRYREIDRGQVSSIIDYIQFQRFVPRFAMTGDERQEAIAAREPNFTMRGRTPQTLLRQVKRWHSNVHETFLFGTLEWPPCGIAGMELLEESRNGEITAWTIHELLSSKALVQEGAAMNHCVATYADLCQQGESSIWSLQRETSQDKTRMLTIEVRPYQRRICDYSGKFNREATSDELRILRHWANQAKLQLSW